MAKMIIEYTEGVGVNIHLEGGGADICIMALAAVSSFARRVHLPLRETLLRMASLSDSFEASIDSVVSTNRGDVEAALERIRERGGKEAGDDHTGAG